MKHLKIILIILVFSFVYIAPKLAFAAEPAPALSAPKVCVAGCWCTSKGGAIKLPSSLGQDACTAACKKVGERAVACAFTVDQLPERSPYCFTKDICAKQNGILDKKQATDCISGQSYCFADPAKAAKVALNVAIPNPVDPSKPLTLTGDIGEYINAVFSFMINAGMVIAIVMVMIGGLQYTIGASTKDGVSKGKDRIKNGITGFVLLLCVNLIASTVNPYLIRLKVPEFPMVKRIDLVKAASCEDMELEHIIKAVDGSDIPADQKKCGKSGSILSKKDGGAVAGATSCDYTKCPTAQEGCLGTGVNAKCLRCSALVPGLAGISPSSGSCSQLKVKDDITTIDGKVVTTTANYCFYTHDPTVIVSAAQSIAFVAATGLATIVTGGFGGAAVATFFAPDIVNNIYAGACAEANINCNLIKKCDDYDKKATAFSDLTGGVGGSQSSMENFFLGNLWGDFNLEKLCVKNPCDVKFYAEDDSVVNGIAQSNVCQINPGKDYSLWDAAKNDCVQKGKVEIGESEKIIKSGSCDPKTCTGKCIDDATGGKACVMSCGEMSDTNTLSGGKLLKPTTGVCKEFTVSEFDRCLHTKDGNATGFDPLKSEGSCVSVKINCNNITECEDYDDKVFGTGANTGGNVNLEDLNGPPNIFDTICVEDPCKIGQKTGKVCKYDGGSDCESK